MKPLIIWDFDGTLYNSRDSYICYASHVRDLAGIGNEPFFNRCQDAIMGKGPYVGEDGWAIVATIAREFGVDHFLQQSFELTRESMNRGKIPIQRTNEAIDILERKDCDHILVTNTPEKYGRPVLKALRLLDYFNSIVYGAKKPEGLKTLGEKLMEDPEFDPKMVLSVGDNYTNDIKISEILGFTTLYIESYGSGYTGTMTVRKFQEGIPFIEKFLLTHR